MLKGVYYAGREVQILQSAKRDNRIARSNLRDENVPVKQTDFLKSFLYIFNHFQIFREPCIHRKKFLVPMYKESTILPS